MVALVTQGVLLLLGALGAYQIGRTVNLGRHLGDPWQYVA
jgi:hypothetical protein